MKHGKTEEVVFLAGGALLGAAVMYMLDPEVGRRRRQRLAKAAGHSYDEARETAAEYWHRVRSGAKNAAHRAHDTAADYTHELADQARDIAAGLTGKAAGYLHSGEKAAAGYQHQAGKWGTRWLGRAQDAWSDATEAAHDAAGNAHDMADHAWRHGLHLRDLGGRIWDGAQRIGSKIGHLPGAFWHHAQEVGDDVSSQAKGWKKHLGKRAQHQADRAGAWLGYKPKDEGVSTTTAIITGAGLCAVGAGMVYFLDPTNGRSRRQWVGSAATDIVQKTGKTMWTTGRNVADRLHTMLGGKHAEQERQRMDSEQLIRRIRSAIAPAMDASQIQFMADAEGTVTVLGEISRAEVDQLLSLVHGVTGVRYIINRLSIQEPQSTGQRASTAPASKM